MTQPSDDIQRIAFEDLFNLEYIQRLQDFVAEATGVACQILRPDGTFITERSNYCRLCGDIIRGTEKGLANCSESDTSLGKLNLDGPNIYLCRSAGFLEAGAPICVGGKHIATWGLGQVRDGTQTETGIRAYAREIGADEDAAAEAFREVTVMSREHFEKVGRMMHAIANQLARIGYQNIQQARLIDQNKLAETALRQSESRLRAFIDNFPGVAFISDPGKCLLFANKNLADQYGINASDIIGRDFKEYVPPEFCTKLIEQDRVVVSENRPLNIEETVPVEAVLSEWLTCKFPIAREGGGTLVGGFGIDITERKRAQEKEKELSEIAAASKRQAEDTIESMPDGLFLTDASGKLISFNKAMEQITGYTKAEVLDSPATDFFRRVLSPDDLKKASQDIGASMQGKSISPATYSITRKDGETIQVLVFGTHLTNSEGQPTYFLSTVKDITELKRAEETLKQNEYYLQKAQELGNIGTWELDLRLNRLVWTDENCRIFSVPPGSVVNYEVFLEKVHPDDREYVDREWKAALDGKPYDIDHRILIDGKPRWVREKADVTFDEQGKAVSAVGFTQDITERKVAEAELLQSEARFRNLFENATFGIIVCRLLRDRDGNAVDFEHLEVNEATRKHTGFETAQLRGKRASEIVSPEETAWLVNQYKQVIATGKPRDYQRYFSAYDRTLDVGAIFLAGDLFAVTFVDVSERIRATAALRESVEKFGSMVENVGFGVTLVNRDMKVIEMNRQMREWFPHVKPEDKPACYKSFNEPSQKDPCEICPTAKTLRDGGAHESLMRLSQAGTDRRFRVISSPIRDAEGNVTASIEMVEDVTERLALEAQLRQAQKMESIGTLAGGIAHDFNNILGIVLGFTQLASIDSPEGSKQKINLQRAISAVRRGTELVSRMLTFSRQKEQERKSLDLVSVVDEALKLLRASIPATVEIDAKMELEDATILGDQTQIHQILINLCTNASQAMGSEGGVLGIGLLQRTLVTTDLTEFPELTPGTYVEMTVSDTGIGMPRDVLQRIFEPYFTTKDPGEGTGLGLAVVHGIVESHGGAIRVCSEPGKGTTFRVVLPRFDASPVPETVEKVPLGHPPPARILLVDDEEGLIDYGKQMLEVLGHKVLAHTSSSEALGTFRKSPDMFDLVITDMTMPQMTGAALAQEILKIRPDIPVILCTGYSESIDLNKARAVGIRELLMKPVLIRDLERAIGRVLHETSSSVLN